MVRIIGKKPELFPADWVSRYELQADLRTIKIADAEGGGAFQCIGSLHRDVERFSTFSIMRDTENVLADKEDNEQEKHHIRVGDEIVDVEHEESPFSD